MAPFCALSPLGEKEAKYAGESEGVGGQTGEEAGEEEADEEEVAAHSAHPTQNRAAKKGSYNSALPTYA